MKQEHKIAIEKLKKLAIDFPNDLMLFSTNSTLLVVNTMTNEVIAVINGIHNDGGDIDTMIVGEREFLVYKK